MVNIEIMRKEVSMPFDDVVDLVQKLMTEQGFTVLMTKAIDEVIKKKLGIKDYPRYSIILGCGADLAKMALDISKDVGTLFPCSFVVYEEERLKNTIVAHVSIMKIAAELEFASKESMSPIIQKTSEKVQAIWQQI